MFSTNQGKFALSNAAMKLAARRVASNPDKIEAAVRAAMWHDASAFFGINNRFDKSVRYEVIAPIVWVSGCTGSGKHELTHAASRSAGRAGAQVITLTTLPDMAYRWHEDEREVFDIREKTLEVAELRRLMKRNDPHLIIRLPVLAKACPERISEVQIFIEEVIQLLNENMIFVIDRFVLDVVNLPKLMQHLRAQIRTTGVSAIVSIEERKFSADLVMKGDAEIVMRGIDSTDFDGALPELIEGEGFLVQNGKVIPVLSDYEFTYEPMHVLPAKARNVVKRLKAQLSGGGDLGHIGRLDAVARACGYRNWHTAQGRRY
ncbi:hypothetical protein ACGYLO_10565 [Sulfitobacter sp. 1A13353]|uniref:hypothetical protein n=1 Tax=Sulfitobacter sp. 1A13353 TaxID=3368568 RepID=UPI0037463A84